MMYLSRLQLNTNNRQVWRELANPYKVHQMVMRAFPDGAKREKAQVLHRLDLQDEEAILLVQSNFEPDWSNLKPNYLAPADPYHFLPNPAVKPFNLSLQAGQVLSFRLCANPTIKKVRRDEKGERLNSNRVPLVHEEKQLAWLQQKGEQYGFHLLRASASASTQHKGWKEQDAPPITLYTVQFDGLLRVINPDKLWQAIQTGIGPSRAFGCGLLSLARATA